MMPISELPMGIFDQSDEKRQLGPEASAATHLSKLEQKRKARKLSTMSGIMMDKWSTVQGKEFFCRRCLVLAGMLSNSHHRRAPLRNSQVDEIWVE